MNSEVQLALWIAQPVLQLCVGAVLYWRKLHRAFPIFFIYLCSQLVTFAVTFPFFKWGSYSHFFYAFWICQAVSLIIGFKVIHEIFLDVFRPYHTLKDLGSVLFKWAALVMLLVAGVVAAASTAGEQDPLLQAVLTVQRCVRVIQCGLILFLLVFAKYLGVSRRQHSFGIALGFGSFASVELLMVALLSSGHITTATVSRMNTLAYDAAILIWLGYALLKSPARDASANLLMSQRWEQSLTDIQHPATSDSLIPMFEGMVDRAFSRTNGDPTHVRSEPEPAPAHRMSSVGRLQKALSPHRVTSKT